MEQALHTDSVFPYREGVIRMKRDLARAATTLSADEARFLVEAYYDHQKSRIAAGERVRSLSKAEVPHEVLGWEMEQSGVIENQIKRALDLYSASTPLGHWARSIMGVGPVIAAGLMAHIDPKIAKTSGAVWRFAGLDSSSEWKKGEKRPWNAKLKTLTWKLGESFVKQSSRDGDIYGALYLQRKVVEIERNEAGDFTEQAAAKLVRYNIGKETDAHKCYAAGKLPPAHIHARAKRYAVKMFLSHYFEIAYFLEHGERAAAPYALAHMEHVHYMPPPHTELVAGWDEATADD